MGKKPYGNTTMIISTVAALLVVHNRHFLFCCPLSIVRLLAGEGTLHLQPGIARDILRDRYDAILHNLLLSPNSIEYLFLWSIDLNLLFSPVIVFTSLQLLGHAQVKQICYLLAFCECARDLLPSAYRVHHFNRHYRRIHRHTSKSQTKNSSLCVLVQL